jgi:uncharacterized protein (TIGR00369 family)
MAAGRAGGHARAILRAPAAASTAQPPADGYFAALQRGEAPLPPVTTTLGGRILALDLDALTMVSAYEGSAAFLNPAGTVQGGVLGAMLDDVTAFLVTATLGAGEHCATLDLHLSFLRPARPGPLEGRSRVLRRGREVLHVQGELWQDGRQVATAAATCLVARAR